MRTKLFFVLLSILIGFSLLPLLAADKVTPLNLKEGLWEVTVTHSMTGMPAMPAIPPETLAKMPADQRARVEAAMKGTGGGPKTDVRKECVTKEKLEKQTAFGESRVDCTRTVVNSTGSKLEIKIHCQEKQTASDGTFVVEAVSSESARGSMHTVTNSNGRMMNIDFTFSTKYLGADCGAVK